jgi:hypothetical protein
VNIGGTPGRYDETGNGIACPRCGGRVERIRRVWSDRLISLVLPVRRYRCCTLMCGWQGRLRTRR